MKTCKLCKVEKSLDMFYRHCKSTDYYQSYCIPCFKQYYIDNRSRFQKSIRQNHIKRTYGLSPEEFDVLKKSQNNVCAICSRGDRLLCVDHNHETGKIRGLLCMQCNSGIGYFKDDVDLTEKAANYLRSYL